MSDERRYSEAELRTIIERAAQRQESSRRAQEASEAGLTLAELQQIGAASGIDPAHIALAAKEVSSGPSAPPSKPDTLAGMPTALRRSVFIPHAVSDASWAQIVAKLRDTFDTNGVAGEVGRTREWTSQVRRKTGGAIHFAFEPVEGGTHVSVEQSWRGSAWAFTGVSIGYAFAASLLSLLMMAGQLGDGDAFVPIIFAVFAILMFGGSQVGMRLYAKRQERRFERALDQIGTIVRETEAKTEASATSGVQDRAPRLDLDALPGEDGAVPMAARDRTRT